MTARQDAVDEAIAYLQSPRQAMVLSTKIITELSAIEGFDDLPEEFRQAIEQRAAQLYGAGFVRGVLWERELVK